MKTTAWMAFSLIVCGLALGSSRLGAVAADEKPVQGKFVPLFGTPTWTIHKGTTNTWAFSDDGTVFTQGGGGGWLMTKREYGNFELRLEIKMETDADTGIAIRSSLDLDPSFEGTQIQFVDEKRSKDWAREDRTGGIWDVEPPLKENVTKKVGEWNKVHIVATGRRVKVSINDTLVLDVNLDDYKDRVDQKAKGKHKHPDLLREKGHIGLQAWKGRIEFRNVEIKELE
jgi:hypothetical protein